MAQAQAGDTAAFGRLVDRHSTRLRRVLYRITRDCEAAYDAVQEALIKAWQNIRRFRRQARFSTWLTSIGINEAYRGLRQHRAELLDPQDLLDQRVPSWGSKPDEVVETNEFLAAVSRALDELPDDYQVAVRLRDAEGLTAAEAARLLDIGERALKSRLHRGRNALRAKLEITSLKEH